MKEEPEKIEHQPANFFLEKPHKNRKLYQINAKLVCLQSKVAYF